MVALSLEITLFFEYVMSKFRIAKLSTPQLVVPVNRKEEKKQRNDNEKPGLERGRIRNRPV